MGRNEKREKIGKVIDLAGSRLKSSEYDELYDVVENPEEYINSAKSFRSSHDGSYSGGKYRREEESTYRIRSENGRIIGEKEYKYHDDDGQSGGEITTFDTAREILNVVRIIAGHSADAVSKSRKALDRISSDKARKRHEEQYAKSQSSFEEDEECSNGVDNQAIVDAIEIMLTGVVKVIPKAIRLFAENGAPAARAIGNAITRKNSKDE